MFNIGDHIKTKIDNVFHHGIFISDDEVIHFCSNEKFSILSNDLEIQATTLAVFAQENKVEIVEHDNKYEPCKIAEIAKSKIGNRDYDIIFNNCEHFVNSCICGEKESQTMNTLKERGLKIQRKNGLNGAIDKIYRTIRK